METARLGAELARMVMVIFSCQTQQRLEQDGWVEGERSYASAVKGHWAYPALQVALKEFEAATESKDEMQVKVATLKLRKVRGLFHLWFSTGQA